MFPGDSQFQELLLNYSQETDSARRKKLEEKIWRSYGTENTVLVLDMSGFSLLTRKYGIIHYLSMIRRMQLTVEPIIASHEGKIIKFEADNCFAILPNPLLAVRAAITIQHAFYASNLLSADELDIRVAIGIDFGKVLIVNDRDMFGEAVNRACKLGEDVGNANDILITKEAMALIPKEAEITGRFIDISIGGLTIPAYSVFYKTE